MGLGVTNGEFGSISQKASSGGGGGAVSKIASQTLSGPEAAVTFSAIPDTFANLHITFQARSDDAATEGDFMEMQFNGDVDANYDYTLTRTTNTAVSSIPEIAQNAIGVSNIAAAAATAGSAGLGDISIPDYTGTVFQKQANVSGGYCDAQNAGNDTQVLAGVGQWRNTEAITSITFILSSGANFIAGSTFSLYGLS